MTLKTTIGLVKHVPAGSQLSYGRTYTAETDRVIATVPIGYADGYNRNLSNDARMLVNGKFAPVVGRICMDQCMLDVTDIPDVKMGDEVVVFGKQGDEVLPRAAYIAEVSPSRLCVPAHFLLHLHKIR